MTNPATKPDPLDGMFTAATLATEDIPPIEYVIPGLVAEGLTLLVAPPKIGKSWWVLGVAAAVCEGGLVFGAIEVDKRPVLYLALEDGRGRLQRRQQTINAPESNWLNFLTMADLNASVTETITAFVERNAAHKPLVILDTLGKARGMYSGNDAYGRDYSEMSVLKNIVDEYPGSSLIVVHHTNKGEKSDFLDSVSGTQGLAGAADSTLLIKRERNTDEATIHVTSRDAEEGEYAFTLDDGTWALVGTDLIEAAKTAQSRSITAGLGGDMTAVIDEVNKGTDGIAAPQVAEKLNLDVDKVRTYLKRAYDEGRIHRIKRGLYGSVSSVRSVSSESESNSNNRTNTLTEQTSTKPKCQQHGTHYAVSTCLTCRGLAKETA